MSDTLEPLTDVADSLIEAAQFIRAFRDKQFVICISERVHTDASRLQVCLQDVLFIQTVGIRPVVVHGATVGSQDTGRSTAADFTFVNERIAEAYEKIGGRAMTLNFDSTPVLTGQPGVVEPGGGTSEKTNIERGEVTLVDRMVIDNLCYAGQVPVVPAVCSSVDGEILEVSELDAATAIAQNINAEKLIVLLDKKLHIGRELPFSLSQDLANTLIADTDIDSDLRDAIETGIRAIESSVKNVHFLDAATRHAMLLEIFTASGIGVELTGD